VFVCVPLTAIGIIELNFVVEGTTFHLLYGILYFGVF
jgi:hypothetical protein